MKVKQKISQIKHGFEVICATATPEITSLKCNDLEPPNIFLVCCEKLIRPYETLVVSLK